ncbi:DUF5753 domain-containing protein [Streptomyces sp. HNM0574]|uniref:DUF5753 domain-containing protein n=1 Tax=Streptomyces sp. HNM0574 TaxID=2714954 RepID=UPI00146A158D|nr:DUF5753 domain-containing protein [Streptomyces sp. HNM0574]NLU67479.1 helix-turn-helix domain-containing protein [Streptomyces sp. HNM0574]
MAPDEGERELPCGDAEFEALLQRSSLGGEGVARLRRRTTPARAHAVRGLGRLQDRLDHAAPSPEELRRITALLRSLGHDARADEVAARQALLSRVHGSAAPPQPRPAAPGHLAPVMTAGPVRGADRVSFCHHPEAHTPARLPAASSLATVTDSEPAYGPDECCPAASLRPPEVDARGLDQETQRMLLATELRRLRRESRLLPAPAATPLGIGPSALRDIELGRRTPSPHQVAALLEVYRAGEAYRRWLGVLAEAVQHRPLRQRTPGAALLAELEASASLIRSYEIQVVPPLLQTPEYCRAMYRAASPAERPSARDVRRKADEVAARREGFLHPGRGTRLWAVLDEMVLHRRVSDDDGVHRAQVEYLLELSEHPRVTLQIIPRHLSYPMPGRLTVVRPHDRRMTDVVYIEYLTGVLYLRNRSELDSYTAAWHTLAVQAETPAETQRRLVQYLSAVR